MPSEEVKVYVPVVVPARIAELVRAVLVRHRAGPHELRDRLLEFAPQAGGAAFMTRA